MTKAENSRGGWTRLVSDDVATTVSDHTNDGAGSVDGVGQNGAFMIRFQLRCQCLALANYIFVPVVYFLAYIGQAPFAYLVVAIQVLGGTYQQVKLLLSLRRWCSPFPHLLGAFNSRLKSASLGCVPHPLALLICYGGLPEWLCLVVDAICFGNSWLAWQTVPEHNFKEWCPLPLPDALISHGLPLLLSLSLFCSMLLQLWEGSSRCSTSLRRQELLNLGDAPLDSVEAAGKRYMVWQELASCAHVNSLVLLADGLQALGVAEISWLCSQREYEVVDAATSIWAAGCCCPGGVCARKLCAKMFAGVLPSLWLTVTLLAMIFDTANEVTRLTCIVSICVSAVTLSKSMVEQMLGWRSEISTVSASAVCTGGIVCLLGICAARFAGVYFCDSHHLDVWDFECAPWNATWGIPSRYPNYSHDYANYKDNEVVHTHGVDVEFES